MGRKIQEVRYVHDYAQLFFEGGIILNVNDLPRANHGNSLSAFKGMTVAIAAESESAVVLSMGNGANLVIGLGDPSMMGLEYLELYLPGEPMVVWN